ncbi:MAG: MFS transporter, partial [Erysipelotrichia bacterium]|nr:MFS transporter [Erysipelotrichia bacterium]
HMSSIEQRGKYLALSATFTTVFGAFGYMVGGFVGVVSIPITFALQSVTLITSGILFYFCLKEDKEENLDAIHLWKDANPLQAFIDSKKFMTGLFALLFFVVFLTSTASTAYDQSFNYYIKDQFDFNSSYNGMLKAVVGFISLLANTTICIWIMNHTKVSRSIVVVLGLGGAFLIGVSLLDAILPFIIMNIMFFAINAIYIPLLQDMCASRSSHKDSDMVMGFYNAMKSLGMISGALFAGFIYSYGAKLAFIFAGVFFLIAMFLMMIYYVLIKKNEESVS